MGGIMDAIEFLGIPGSIAVIVVALFLIMQIIGELVELTGKVVPEFLKIRKYFKRRKEEKNKQKILLEDVQASLNEMKQHYSPEKLAQRDAWMQGVNDKIEWVNDRAEIYDASVASLTELKDVLQANNELTLDLYINVNRHRIIDFASKVANEDMAVSREEFNRIFKVYNEYEDILEQHNKTNGEVDIAYRIINESYANHMRNHSFIEDIRGYNKK